MGHKCVSQLGTDGPGERPNLSFCWNIKAWIISLFEILDGVNW